MVDVVSTSSVSCRAVPWDVAHHGEIYAWWQQILSRLPKVTVYHYPEWTALARLSGIVNPWRVLLFSRNGEPLAIIPLKKRNAWCADIIGEYSYENPPLLIDPAAEEEVWACLAAWIRSHPGIELLYLGRHCDADRVERFTRAARQHGAVAYTPQVLPVITIPLSESWEQYLESLGHRTRANVRRLERQFAQEMPDATFDVITTTPAADEALTELIDLYRRRWQQSVSGSSLDQPARAGYYQEVFHWAIQQGLSAIPVVRIGGKIVATLTLFRIPGQDTMYVHMFARERDVELPKHFSLGILLCSKTIQWAIEQGIRYMGMSYGSAEYKQLLGGNEQACWEVYLARSPLERKFWYRMNCLDHHVRRLPVYLRYAMRHVRRGNRR